MIEHVFNTVDKTILLFLKDAIPIIVNGILYICLRITVKMDFRVKIFIIKWIKNNI